MSVKLKRIESGIYETEDGRYRIEKDFHYTGCMGEHPVRIPRATREAIRARLYDRRPDRRPVEWDFSKNAVMAVQMGERGYICYGDEEHIRWAWQIWDIEKDDYVNGGEDFDTKKDAVSYLERYVLKWHDQ